METLEELPESGRTEVRRGVAFVFVAACALTVLAVPLVRHVLPVDGVWLRLDPFTSFLSSLAELKTVDGPRLMNRRLEEDMDDFERSLEDSSPLMATVLPPIQWLLAGWGGAGNEKVYVGRLGWLFYRPGFDYLVGPPFLDPSVLERRRRSGPSWSEPPEGDPRPALLDFHRQLAARGIRLLVMPVPTKPMIHPEDFAPSYARRPDDAPPLQNPSFDEFREDLEAAGVLFYDPAGNLRRLRREGSDAFLHTDSHWSPAGVDAVARELASRIRILELGSLGSPVSWRRVPRDHVGRGDLARTLRLPSWGEHLFPPETARLDVVTDPEGRFFEEDRGAAVLVLGDSFTNVFSDAGLGWGRSAGLAEQLAFYLGAGVDRIALNNAGGTLVRRRLAADPQRLQGKKLVVYEVAVRELSSGDWQKVALPE